jgi:hypothetical protein
MGPVRQRLSQRRGHDEFRYRVCGPRPGQGASGGRHRVMLLAVVDHRGHGQER